MKKGFYVGFIQSRLSEGLKKISLWVIESRFFLIAVLFFIAEFKYDP